MANLPQWESSQNLNSESENPLKERQCGQKYLKQAIIILQVNIRNYQSLDNLNTHAIVVVLSTSVK